MKDNDFYKRVRESLPCNMDDWTEAQIRAEYSEQPIGKTPAFT